MTTLWDTTGTAVVAALAAERRTGGAVTSGLALTLVVVVDETDVAEAESAATVAASKHPMRMLLVIRRQIEAPVPRLDAEVLIGGRLGPGEAYLPVLVLTADVSRESKRAALEAGASDFVTKPFEQIELLLRVRNLIEMRCLHKDLRRQNEDLETQVQERTNQLPRHAA
jgi:DNA-binding response OmpR family regulator